jgi:hypothetical protein
MKVSLLLSVVMLSAMTACNKRQGPSLSETLAWMAQTYNSREDGFGGHGWSLGKCMAKCEDVGAEVSLHETFNYKGCQITTTTISNREGDHGLHETFNLRDIDPQSIRVLNNPPLGDVAEVKFSTRNNVEALVYTGNTIGKSDNSEFTMDDLAYAGRFTEAFRHAVELCGGKPSAF